MPIKHAAEKALRQTKTHAKRNRAVKDNLKKTLREARVALELKDQDKARASVLAAIKTLDRAAQKGIIKPNNAARKKSRLMKKLIALK